MCIADAICLLPGLRRRWRRASRRAGPARSPSSCVDGATYVLDHGSPPRTQSKRPVRFAAPLAGAARRWRPSSSIASTRTVGSATAPRAGGRPAGRAAMVELIENRAELQAVNDAETAVLAPSQPTWEPSPMATVPLLSTDVHDLQGLAEIADLLFDRRSPGVQPLARSGRLAWIASPARRNRARPRTAAPARAHPGPAGVWRRGSSLPVRRNRAGLAAVQPAGPQRPPAGPPGRAASPAGGCVVTDATEPRQIGRGPPPIAAAR